MTRRRLAVVVSSAFVTVLAAGSATGSPPAASAPDTLAFVSTVTGILSLTQSGLVQKPLLKTRSVGGFAWSPDGRRIAYVSSGRLHVINADGSGARQLRATPIDGRIAWAPDGRRIAFTGAGGGSVQLYTIAIAGGPPRALTTSVPASVLPSWSSRGSTIAFTSANTNFGHIYTVRPDGTGLRKLTRGREESFPSWSPHGSLIMFQPYNCPAGTCGYGISVMRPDGSRQQLLAHVPGAPGGGGLHATWSPNSRRIAFLRLRNRGVGSEIRVVNVEGTGLRTLATDSRSFSPVSWSPDGRRIAYVRDSSIYLMSADGSGKRPLVEFAALPAWQPRR